MVLVAPELNSEKFNHDVRPVAGSLKSARIAASTSGIPFSRASQSGCRSFKCLPSSASPPWRGTKRMSASLRGVESPFFKYPWIYAFYDER
jgi:hypothetical protein